MGCNNPHPGRPGSCIGFLGDRWVAGMGGTRIVPPFDYPVRYSGRACMKRGSHAFLSPAKKEGPAIRPVLLRGSDFCSVRLADFSRDLGFQRAISLHLTAPEELPASS